MPNFSPGGKAPRGPLRVECGLGIFFENACMHAPCRDGSWIERDGVQDPTTTVGPPPTLESNQSNPGHSITESSIPLGTPATTLPLKLLAEPQ